MLTLLKQARSALSLLNPEEVRSRSGRLVTIGLVASSDHAYARWRISWPAAAARASSFSAPATRALRNASTW